MEKLLLSFFRGSALSDIQKELLLKKMQTISSGIVSLEAEWRFYVDVSSPLTDEESERLSWLLSESFQREQFGSQTNFDSENVLEVGPRLGTITPHSTNAVLICRACGLTKVTRVERATRYSLVMAPGSRLNPRQARALSRMVRDRMTEEMHEKALKTFDPGITPDPVKTIPLIEEGPAAFQKFAEDTGLSLWPVLEQYIYNYFVYKLGRNPTDVEIFMFGQLNSEHCRHHLFNGRFIIDGVKKRQTLFRMIRSTVDKGLGRIAVAFTDNAAVEKPRDIMAFVPENPLGPSRFVIRPMRYCFVIKIETHNHPTTISPYPGAGTGTAVVRDILGTGQGGVPTTHMACYYVDNLFIPGYELPWETRHAPHPTRFATPLEIIIEASNGASDVCNCRGNAVTLGSCTSFGGKIGSSIYGYTKTVMVAGSAGFTIEGNIRKDEASAGMLIVETGGDAFKIGLGGGSGSSKDAGTQGEDLDYNSVQRADPVMEKGNIDVFRACLELGDKNPIRTTTDLGAGGCCVAIPELLHPAGGRVELRSIPCGDSSIPAYIIFCNESQERMVVLINPEDLDMFLGICRRFRCPASVVGEVTGDGKFVLTDRDAGEEAPREERLPIDVDSDFLLADLPQVEIDCITKKRELVPFQVPDAPIGEMLDRVLRLLKVGSKHFLTRKADRSVSGLVAQQQTVGPMQLPLGDYAVTADSFTDTTGEAMAIGEQPIVGLVNTEAGARMSVAEALLNLAFAPVNGLESVNLSATWQWPCKQPGEDARLYAAVKAVTDFCKKFRKPLSIVVGKDSVSMTAMTESDGESIPIMAPGTVQIVSFAKCIDITRGVTPDIKEPGKSHLMYIDLSGGLQRMGGSALAQVYEQFGNEAPDVCADFLERGFNAIQELVKKGLILSGHDRSDGGLITCLLEMAFAGNCGLDIDLFRLSKDTDWVRYLFNQEPGAVIEYLPKNLYAIKMVLRSHRLGHALSRVIGKTQNDASVVFRHNDKVIYEEKMVNLRRVWSETSSRLDALQANPEVVREESRNVLDRPGPKSTLTFVPRPTSMSVMSKKRKPSVAILCEKGTNGDREMAYAFELAGFNVLGLHMTDLLDGRASLKKVRGVVVPGGFAFGDVLDAGKGEAGVIRFNPRIAQEFEDFMARDDTFGLGICNGCQLFALAGIVPWGHIPTEKQPRFIRNTSEIFESRFVSVKIVESNSIFFRGMAGSTLGVWVAHGQGRLHCPDASILREVVSGGMAPLRYADDEGLFTEKYPFNPNGSPLGIAGLTSMNGRFAALMPHPERLVIWPWQWPYIPKEWKKLKASPWLKMFQNARVWCEERS